MEYIKKAMKTAESNSETVRGVVRKILTEIEERGETAVRELAKKFDGWEGDFVLSPEKKQRLIDTVPENVKADFRFAYKQVSGFAKAQRESITEFEKEAPPPFPPPAFAWARKSSPWPWPVAMCRADDSPMHAPPS